MATTYATAIITSTSITINLYPQLPTSPQIISARPESFADADTFLASHGFRRYTPWELNDEGAVSAEAHSVDNVFNGTRAARLWGAMDTTHEEWEVTLAGKVRDGDLISDMEISEPYVVAGSRLDGNVIRVHMVGECKTWEERYTTDFPVGQLVQLARRKA